MKRLKLFEEYNDKDRLFWEINIEEFCKKVHGRGYGGGIDKDYIKSNRIDFTFKEISHIKENGLSVEVDSNFRGKIIVGLDGDLDKRMVFLRRNLEIFKLTDEWYFVSYINNRRVNFICDQFDGLLEFLKYAKNNL